MHTPGARPVLRALGLPCPVKSASAAQVTALREQGLSKLRGVGAAPARPALGLSLDHTTEQQALSWAQASGAVCESVTKGYRFLRCRGVPAAALGAAGPPISELWLSFGPTGALVGVDLYRRGLDADGARTSWNDAAARLFGALGPPQVAVGDPSPEALSALTLGTAQIKYRYADYLATLTAANLPHAGLAVREQYLSAAQ
jgi:hypothetical protein